MPCPSIQPPDQSAFEARNGLAHSDRIAGEFSPSRLDNAGERIHLVNGLGTTIADFTYNDKSPWPSEAGFTGYSMVLRSFAIADPNYSSPGHWRSSGFLGGNPNSSDSAALVGTPGDDDDQDGLDKLLEHALGSDDAIPDPPNSSFTTAVQSLLVNGAVNNYLTITYRRNLLADDVFLILQGSYDLETWFGGDVEFPIVSKVNQGDGTSIITRRTAAPYDPATTPAIFLRLQAQSALTTSLIAWMAGIHATDPMAPFGNSSLSNLMAYAVGADLTPTPAEALPVLSIVNDAGVDYPALTFRSRLGANDISFTVEVSDDLLTWQSGSAVTEIVPRQDNGDGTETITVRSMQSVTSGAVQSLRLRVTVN